MSCVQTSLPIRYIACIMTCSWVFKKNYSRFNIHIFWKKPSPNINFSTRNRLFPSLSVASNCLHSQIIAKFLKLTVFKPNIVGLWPHPWPLNTVLPRMGSLSHATASSTEPWPFSEAGGAAIIPSPFTYQSHFSEYFTSNLSHQSTWRFH